MVNDALIHMLILYNSQHMFRRIRRRIFTKFNLLDKNISITSGEIKYNIVIQKTQCYIYVYILGLFVYYLWAPSKILGYQFTREYRMVLSFVLPFANFFRLEKNEKPSNITGMHALIDNWIWNSDRQSFMQLKCAVSKRSTAHSLKTICR